MIEQNYDFFLILDFEATCSDTDPNFRNEIIEFPIVALDAKTGKRVAEFRHYVRPVINPKLTKFCTTLTGITQETVDAADTFPTVFQKAQDFYRRFHEKHGNPRTIFVTCGDWDLRKMLPEQARMCNMDVPEPFGKWINVKNPFRDWRPDFKGRKSGGIGMTTMLKLLNLPLEGRHHSGLDDSRNIASIVWALIQKKTLIK